MVQIHIMAMILIYWFENAELATQLLHQLIAQVGAVLCSSAFRQLSEYSFQRRFLQACVERARTVVTQYQQHARVGLTSPFFCGQHVTLDLCTRMKIYVCVYVYGGVGGGGGGCLL
jgi:hypothetical protein